MGSGLVRRITADEVAFFAENGWVKLDRLIAPETAARLLDAAKRLLDEAEAIVEPVRSGDVRIAPDSTRRERSHDTLAWRDYYFPSADDPLFHEVSHSPDLGYTMQQLLRRDVGVRYCVDMIMCKFPQAGGGHARTEWHQDFPGFPYDRIGNMACWIALDEVTPEHGSMRFFSRSQVEGPLGQMFGEGADTLAVHPYLEERYELSPPLHYRPGDATVHHGLMVHGAPPNTAGSPRWSLVVSCFPSDARYTGQPWTLGRGYDLEVGKPLPEQRFPEIYA